MLTALRSSLTVVALVTVPWSLLAQTTGAAGPENVRGVAPGSIDAFLSSATSCPTFSWASTVASDGIELEVVAVGDRDSAESGGERGFRKVLQARLPAGASSWTPSAEQCLTPGFSYTWSVRTLVAGEVAAESEGLLFRVAERPSLAAVRWAQEILLHHLESDAGPRSTRRNDLRSGGSVATAGTTTTQPTESEGSPVPEEGAASAGGTVPAAAINVEGRIEASGLTATATPPTSTGSVLAEGSISLPSGGIAGSQLRFNEIGGNLDVFYTLQSPQAGYAVLCQADSPCETSGDPDSKMTVGKLTATDLVSVIPGGLLVAEVDPSWHGTGGAGYFSAPSILNVRVDDNSSSCPGDGVMIGVRLWETDAGQIGIQVKCSQ